METRNDIFLEDQRQGVSGFYQVYDIFKGRPIQEVFPLINPINQIRQEGITQKPKENTGYQSEGFHLVLNQWQQNEQLSKIDNIFGDIGSHQHDPSRGNQPSVKNYDQYPEHQEHQEEIMKDGPISVEKNNNIVKKFLKTLNQVYYTEGRKFFKDFPQIEKEMNSLTKNHRRKYSEDKNFNNNLNAMKAMFSQFQQSCQPAQRSFLVRKMAHSLIRTEVIPSVMANNQVKSMKKSYLFGLKVQMLRSRSRQLMERTEIH